MKKILVFAIVTLFSISVFAETVFEYNGVYYKKTSSTTACVIANPDGTKYSGDIVIAVTPQRGVFTTAIADSAFYYCKELTSIDLPTSIAVIGKESFRDCRLLKSIKLPNITNVPYDAFCNCKELESVDISNVTTIDEDAFYSCSSLKSISDLSNVKEIPRHAFYRCDSLKSINIPNVITIGERAFQGCAFDTIDLPKVETIGISAFLYCENLKSINMPKVRIIESAALYHCAFTSLNLPATLDSIGGYALSCNSGLKYITIDEANENFVVKDNVLYDKDFTKLIQYPVGQEAKLISVLNTVTTIANSAFASCSFVERVDLPNVKIIEASAFMDCFSLRSVNMPKVTTIGPTAFSDCWWIDSIDIPNVTILESYTFFNCRWLQSINIPNVTILEPHAFNSCDNLKSINISNVTKIGRRAFGYCYDLQKVVLGNVDSIKSEAFIECASLDTFRITAATPPVLEDDVFKDTPSDVLIQVPCGASSLYERVEVWKDFKNYEDWAPEVTVLSNDEKMGLVILDRQTTCENPTAEIEAMPRSGYEFVKWSDESTENPRVVAVEDKGITLTAIFQKVGTDVENVGIEGAIIYSDGNTLYVDGLDSEYQIYSTTGALIYSGNANQITLAQGIYIIRYNGMSEKVIL